MPTGVEAPAGHFRSMGGGNCRSKRPKENGEKEGGRRAGRSGRAVNGVTITHRCCKEFNTFCMENINTAPFY